MPNLASILKSEIARIARKEMRLEIEPLKKALSTYRTDIAALKRRAQAAEQELKRLQKASGTKAGPPPSADAAVPEVMRFSAKGLLSQRERLGLSAEAFGLLVGASGKSVYRWESGASRPRDKHLSAIRALKGMGKKDAAARLESLK